MRLNIIGKGSGWKLAPCVSSKYDTWGVTHVLLRRPVDLVIDMHFYEDMSDGRAKDMGEEVKLRCAAHGVPYIDPHNYPLNEIVTALKTDYFGCTVDYAMGLAIHQKYDEINLYGINMLTADEYAYQKPGVDFWCGYAKGRGVVVNVHGKLSSIMKTRDDCLYGYNTERTH